MLIRLGSALPMKGAEATDYATDLCVRELVSKSRYKSLDASFSFLRWKVGSFAYIKD